MAMVGYGRVTRNAFYGQHRPIGRLRRSSTFPIFAGFTRSTFALIVRAACLGCSFALFLMGEVLSALIPHWDPGRISPGRGRSLGN